MGLMKLAQVNAVMNARYSQGTPHNIGISKGGKVHKVMSEFKKGQLKSSSGQKVTKRKQAIAIALSEAREAGAKIPKKRS